MFNVTHYVSYEVVLYMITILSYVILCIILTHYA